MTAVTTSSRASSHSQQLIHQAMSFCRRHKRPLSVLALELQELESIKADIGAQRIRRLLTHIRHQLLNDKRCEDSLVSCQEGHFLFMVLPATPVDGALAMAQRLETWFSRQEFQLDDFHVSLPVKIMVHCAALSPEENVNDLLNSTLEKPLNAEGDAAIRLTQRAEQQLASLQSTEQITTRLSRELMELAQHGQPAALLETLSPALASLDETLRLQLVDFLLEASTRAKAV